MVDQDKEQFSMIMIGMAENFNAQLSPTGIAMRFECLREHSIETIRQAALSIVKSRKYTNMPTVADFEEFLGGGRAEDIAEVESGKVIDAIKKYGGYANVCFDNPVTQAVIVNGFGGWTTMCSELMVDQHKFFIKDFNRIYSAYSRQNHKRFGRLDGLGNNKTVYIGDPKACFQIENTKQEEFGALPNNVAGLLADSFSLD